jgi:hypothetical protein
MNEDLMRYVCFYNARKDEVLAKSSYEAYRKALELFKPPKSKQHMVSVHLREIPINTASL